MIVIYLIIQNKLDIELKTFSIKKSRIDRNKKRAYLRIMSTYWIFFFFFITYTPQLISVARGGGKNTQIQYLIALD